MGFTLYATRHTSRFLEDHGVPSIRLYKIHERRRPSLLEYIVPGRLDLIINIPAGYDRQELTDGYIIRRKAIDFGIPLVTNLQLAELFVKSIAAKDWKDLKPEAYDRYVPGPRAAEAGQESAAPVAGEDRRKALWGRVGPEGQAVLA
jgi:carbamoyl-phosphate synthase large subunit